GVCNGTCAMGFADCNSNKQSDGCEIKTDSDPNNCGACTSICSNSNMATRTCAAGVCNGTCTAGFADCNSNKKSDGCEINTTNDPFNCSACAVICSANNIAVRTCAASVCNGTCNMGFADCNGNKQ